MQEDILPTQCRLGLNWDLKSDTFIFRVLDANKPSTRQGVLSTLNSLYNSLGFTAPVTIQGKSILRRINVENGDWDAPLTRELEDLWVT